jgi:hypothetical protein
MHINNQRIMAGSSAWHDVVHIQKTALLQLMGWSLVVEAIRASELVRR